MSDKPLKPWQMAMPDDHTNEDAGSSSVESAPARSEDGPADASAPSSAPNSLPSDSRPASDVIARLQLQSAWAAIPLGLALVGILGWSQFLPHDGMESVWWVKPLLAALIAGGIGIILIANWIRRQALKDVAAQIESGITPGNGHRAVPADIKPFLNLLDRHMQVVEDKSREMMNELRQLELDATLAETRCVRQQSVIDSIRDPILAADSYDQILMMNSAAAKLFGCELESSSRRSIKDVVSDERLIELLLAARAADARAADRRVEYEIDSVVCDISVKALGGNRDGDPHGVVCVMRDVTREANAARKKSEFVSHVAHELRTPLSSIRAYVEMLVDGEAEDEASQREYYDIIQTSAERLGRLIDNMLNISRIEAGTVRVSKEPQAISVIVKEAVDIMRPNADDKRLKLVEHLTPVMYQVEADRDLVLQAVLNLISNAIKYTPEGGEVVVQMTADENKGRIVIDVADTGVGIPAEDLPRMFEKFFRVEQNNKMAKGTGLGLNLVKRIVEDVHGGQIALRSEVGKGSTFSVALPLVR